MEDLVLALDIGSTTAKAGLFDRSGRALALGRAGYGSEPEHPDRWWEASRSVVGQVWAAMRGAPAGALRALCVVGQSPTLVPVDATFRPVAPALAWGDGRAAGEAERLTAETGEFVPPEAFVAKAWWVVRHAEQAARVRWWLQSWDSITVRLTGEAAAANWPALRPWSDRLIQAAGLSPERFPPFRTMGSRLGTVSRAAAAETGLPEGLPVIAGASDFFAGLIGTATAAPGMVCDNGGTSTSFTVGVSRPLVGSGLRSVPSFVPGMWHAGGAMSTTGRALDWLREQVLRTDGSLAELLAGAQRIRPGADGLLFVPYLAGERAPLWDPEARGALLGLTLTHTREHLVRAVLEGVACGLAHLAGIVTGLGGEIQMVTVCGGQAKSDLWNQIKADVLGMPVAVPEVLEATLVGAAAVAATGAGLFRDVLEGARQMVRIDHVVAPEGANHDVYADQARAYAQVYPTLKPLYARWPA